MWVPSERHGAEILTEQMQHRVLDPADIPEREQERRACVRVCVRAHMWQDARLGRKAGQGSLRLTVDLKRGGKPTPIG